MAVDILPSNDWKVLQEKFRDFTMLEQQLSNHEVPEQNDCHEITEETGDDSELTEICDVPEIAQTNDYANENSDANIGQLAAKINSIEINSDESKVVPKEGTIDQESKKKTRRKSRGKGKGNKNANADMVIEQVIQLENDNKNTLNQRILRRHLSSTCDDQSLVSIQELKRIYPDSWQNFVQKTGRVVFIFEEKHSRLTVGYLKMFQDKNPNFALFAPLDSKVPRMKIPRNQCPKDFWSRPQDFGEYLFIAKVIKWDQVSFAMGQLMENLGSDGDIEVRTKGTVTENYSIRFLTHPKKKKKKNTRGFMKFPVFNILVFKSIFLEF